MTRHFAILLLLPFLLTACKSKGNGDAAAAPPSKTNTQEADRANREALITSGFTKRDMDAAVEDLCKELSQAHARGDVGAVWILPALICKTWFVKTDLTQGLEISALRAGSHLAPRYTSAWR